GASRGRGRRRSRSAALPHDARGTGESLDVRKLRHGGRLPRYGGWMEYRTLGSTGVKVSPLCLGAMMFGEWGNRDHDDSIKIIHAALDAGINFVDTADVYSAGESEEIVGKALAGGRREHVVLATKAHGAMGED